MFYEGYFVEKLYLTSYIKRNCLSSPLHPIQLISQAELEISNDRRGNIITMRKLFPAAVSTNCGGVEHVRVFLIAD